MASPEVPTSFDYTDCDGKTRRYTEPTFIGKDAAGNVVHKTPPQRVLKGGNLGVKDGEETGPRYKKLYKSGRLTSLVHFDKDGKKHGLELQARVFCGTLRWVKLWEHGTLVKQWNEPEVGEGGTLEDGNYLSMRLTFGADGQKAAREEFTSGSLRKKTVFWPSNGRTKVVLHYDALGRVTKRTPHNTQGHRHGPESVSFPDEKKQVPSWGYWTKFLQKTYVNGELAKVSVPEGLPGWPVVRSTDPPDEVSSLQPRPWHCLREAMLQSLKATGEFDYKSGLQELQTKVVAAFSKSAADLATALRQEKPDLDCLDTLMRHTGVLTRSREGKRKRKREEEDDALVFS